MTASFAALQGSENGPELTSGDVRDLVAIERKAKVTLDPKGTWVADHLGWLATSRPPQEPRAFRGPSKQFFVPKTQNLIDWHRYP
jgi:hypothetical protein